MIAGRGKVWDDPGTTQRMTQKWNLGNTCQILAAATWKSPPSQLLSVWST